MHDEYNYRQHEKVNKMKKSKKKDPITAFLHGTLEEYFEISGVTRSQLAKEIGISRMWLHKIEKGARSGKGLAQLIELKTNGFVRAEKKSGLNPDLPL